MNWIKHIVEPTKLLLTWQTAGETDRTRRIVGELIKVNNIVNLIYLFDTEDFQVAEQLGFQGFGAFQLDINKFEDVLDAFVKRLPPRTRGDYNKFLEAIRILPNTNISEFALLGYSGARVPDDEFTIIHPFNNVVGKCEVLTEIAGFRHNEGMQIFEKLKEGDEVSLIPEPSNKIDSNAIKIVFENKNIGYINRAQLSAFNRWISNQLIDKAVIERINGTKVRPSIYLFVTVK